MILRTWLNELDYELVRGSLDVEVTEVVYVLLCKLII